MTTHKWQPHQIFTFGSNLSGIHGAGAAKFAVGYCGAEWNNAIGLQGKSYAIPTKDENIQTLSLPRIERYVEQFVIFAEAHDELEFFVTEIGCGLAGYNHSDIKWMFRFAPLNCVLPPEWDGMRRQYLHNGGF